MLKVAGLRLGNFINHNGEPMPVVQIERRYKTIFRLNDLDVDERIIEDHFQPIPLTPEWLERCGFEFRKQDEDYIYWGIENFTIIYGGITGGDHGWFLNGYHNDCHIQYLHQLQNLYHALTGEELIITL